MCYLLFVFRALLLVQCDLRFAMCVWCSATCAVYIYIYIYIYTYIHIHISVSRCVLRVACCVSGAASCGAWSSRSPEMIISCKTLFSLLSLNLIHQLCISSLVPVITEMNIIGFKSRHHSQLMVVQATPAQTIPCASYIYIYIYIYIYTYIRTHMYIYVYIYIYISPDCCLDGGVSQQPAESGFIILQYSILYYIINCNVYIYIYIYIYMYTVIYVQAVPDRGAEQATFNSCGLRKAAQAGCAGPRRRIVAMILIIIIMIISIIICYIYIYNIQRERETTIKGASPAASPAASPLIAVINSYV